MIYVVDKIRFDIMYVYISYQKVLRTIFQLLGGCRSWWTFEYPRAHEAEFHV